MCQVQNVSAMHYKITSIHEIIKEIYITIIVKCSQYQADNNQLKLILLKRKWFRYMKER